MKLYAKMGVVLSEEDKGLVERYIIRGRNMVKACNYADMHFLTLKKAMKGESIKAPQRKKLIAYCEKVIAATS